MKIVIVEDEIRIREGICKLIKNMYHNYEIVGEAENGVEGLEIIMRTKPDLVITDIKMPFMDGLEMLTHMYEQKMKTKAIVLSAYSEFSYAQQAMKLGVTEYLLKPIVVSDFTQSIKTMENQCIEEKNMNPQVLGNLENVLFGIIYGGLDPNEELHEFIQNKYGFMSNATFSEIHFYLGEEYEKRHKQIRREIENTLMEKKDIKYSVIEIPKEKTTIVILYACQDLHAVERWLQNRILDRRRKDFGNANISIGWINVEGINCLKSSNQIITKFMDWNIVLGDFVIISYPKILQVQTVPCVYPIEIENQMKVAMCTHDMKKVNICIQKMQEYFGNGQVYAPKEIKESYVRFLWSLMNIAKEIGALDHNNFEQQKILEMIMGAINKEELKIVCDKLVSNIILSEEKESNSATLSVKRAESMIHEFYNTGITLDEIAAKLNITPEYLGTQFHKEIGKNFSTYMKEIRIQKAKELLIGSQKKLYEIAEKVGYADPKYFSRVFKECTGQLPAEYRKTNK